MGWEGREKGGKKRQSELTAEVQNRIGVEDRSWRFIREWQVIQHSQHSQIK